MTKYTIIKAFQKHFPFPIWKIEVDCSNNCLAIEYRDPTDTLPTFAVISFDGGTLLDNYTATEKEWTLEAIQGEFLIFKRFGSSSPLQAGIKVLHFPSKSIIFTHHEYVLKDVHKGRLRAAHRSIPAGLEFFIEIATGIVTNNAEENFTFPDANITYPIPYQGNLPYFIKDLYFEDQIWLQPYKDFFIWSYHKKTGSSFDLHLCLSNKNEILDRKIVLSGLDKLIPQPYFQVKGYIFFLSNTKQEIAAYLV